MRKLLLASLLTLGLLPFPATAQVTVQIDVGLPAQPPLVVIRPGIQVVENWNEEVFVTGGYYWVRRDGAWYRARGPRARFWPVEPHRVPPGLAGMPPGHYRHYDRERVRADERERREHARGEHRERKEREKAERRRARDDDRDEGRRGREGHRRD